MYDLDIEQYRWDGISWPVGRVDVEGLADHFFEVQEHALYAEIEELHRKVDAT